MSTANTATRVRIDGPVFTGDGYDVLDSDTGELRLWNLPTREDAHDAIREAGWFLRDDSYHRRTNMRLRTHDPDPETSPELERVRRAHEAYERATAEMQARLRDLDDATFAAIDAGVPQVEIARVRKVGRSRITNWKHEVARRRALENQ